MGRSLLPPARMSESAAAATPPTPPSRRRVFASRLISTLVLWAVIMTAFEYRSEWLVLAITCLFGVAGAVEYYRLLRSDPQARSFNLLGCIICFVYWVSVGVFLSQNRAANLMWLDLAALTASVHGSFLLCYRHQLEGVLTLQRIFNTVFGVVYTVIFFGFMVKLIYFYPGEPMKGSFLMLFLIMVTKFSDMGAYLVGVCFGRHKMIPHISPGKSWEGLIGAVLGALLGGMLVWWGFRDRMPLLSCAGVAAGISVLLGAVCIVGDLAESVIKRCLGIKDSGKMLPGIGGSLDLIDSLLYTAPVFYFCTYVLGR